jgi:hypothetical protein
MKLRRNEYCPIHRSRFCCGREQRRKEATRRFGVQRIEDPHHPRGFRELRSPAEMRKLLNRKIVEQDRKCAICHEEFTDYGDIVLDHNVALSISLPRLSHNVARRSAGSTGFVAKMVSRRVQR